MPTKNAITVLIFFGTWITVYASTVRQALKTDNKTESINFTEQYKCIDGKIGNNCSEGCPVGTYGHNCAFNCSIHCLDKICEQKIGNCTFGCEYGWDGVYCQEDILTPEELKEQAIILFFQMVGGIMGFYLLQIAFVKYRSLNLGCCCCCKYCPWNREKRRQKKLRELEKLNSKEPTFMVELEPLKCDKRCTKKQIVHVV